MKKIVLILGAAAMVFGLSSCIGDDTSSSYSSFSDVADSVRFAKTDSTWIVSLLCGDLDYSYGKRLDVEIVAPLESAALPTGKFTSRDFSLSLQEGTFRSGYLVFSEGRYDICGTYLLMNQGGVIYSVLFNTGTFEISNDAEGNYDFKFKGTDGSGSISASITAEDLKPVSEESD